jgi:hypothetical protein
MPTFGITKRDDKGVTENDGLGSSILTIYISFPWDTPASRHMSCRYVLVPNCL